MFSNEEITEKNERFRGVWKILGEELTDERIVEAQEQLNRVKEKDAEWHYTQAAVFYYKSWYLDCRRQLREAIKLDPENAKYRSALDELTNMANEAKESGKALPRSGSWSDGCAEGCCLCCEGIC